MKIALTYIVKDDSQAKELEKSIKSFRPYVDGLFVLVNGLSGKHNEINKIVKKYNGVSKSTNEKTHSHIYHKRADGTWFFAHFGNARNEVFAMVPKEYDYITWADSDDVLVGGQQLRPIAEDAKKRHIDMVFFTYAYSNRFDDFGNLLEVLVPHQRERLIANNGKFTWYKRVHENVLEKDQGQPFTKMNYTYKVDGTEIAWIHQQTMEIDQGSHKRNIELLRLEAEEEEYQDPRTIFYLAKSHFDMKTPEDFDIADNFLSMFVKMSGWDQEISQAYEFKGLIKVIKGDLEGALEDYLNALKYNPISHLTNLKLADVYIAKNKVREAEHFLKAYESLPPLTSDSIITSKAEAIALYYTVKFNIAHKTGKIDEAVTWAEKRAEYITDELVNQVKEFAAIEDFAKNYLATATHFAKAGKFEILQQLVDAAPSYFEENEFMKKICNSFPPKVWEEKSIVYFASFYEKHFEEWNGNNISTGIGGSETAVIYLSEYWAKMGYKVVVYCDTPMDIVINGVEYKKYWKINWKDQFSTLIFWRAPQLLDMPVKAKRIFLDMHDVAFPQTFTDYRIDKVDKVFFKSRAHRDQVPHLPDSKAVVISNGIML